ncbi:K+-transporting ATPase ATPase C chain [Pseudomonas sp. TE6288]|uniref:potassium-transporting ATPase subunit KdpC n=1 Tax=Pseudomonas TaxID=286 RepID=UPI000C882636|nr:MULTISPECIES: potassium-transporting ATPase subunit KdpC [Pseudomonas]MDF9757797.1 K+-transporting ATPase ATPase C chain [Pseudomonas hunanensis]PMZ95673.1 potassium-transporting ATPase subunit C [Pseudomonas sp. FW305-42]PNA24031.1 potassium-transporting ATPase subunit C [Pseudomonas sp. MPR-R1B]PNB24685.1 potassium-transporting ATPase subunit C [Pseudomonas sp. DP16D-E2]PNB42104.1 potassium-transporting ATPase subunit C [Pseudomonas sp. FW305-17]
MTAYVRPALSLILLMTVVTGALYPLAVTGIAQVAFPEQANGSLLRDDRGEVRGSALIAQEFKGDAWFQSRPSAGAYATVASGASNLAPSNPALVERVKTDAAAQYQAQQGPVPQALLTTSGSGLDPHLPPEAIAYQLPRVAAARQVSEERLQVLVNDATLRPLIGPPVVNVLALNQALERLAPLAAR